MHKDYFNAISDTSETSKILTSKSVRTFSYPKQSKHREVKRLKKKHILSKKQCGGGLQLALCRGSYFQAAPQLDISIWPEIIWHFRFFLASWENVQLHTRWFRKLVFFHTCKKVFSFCWETGQGEAHGLSQNSSNTAEPFSCHSVGGKPVRDHIPVNPKLWH